MPLLGGRQKSGIFWWYVVPQQRRGGSGWRGEGSETLFFPLFDLEAFKTCESTIKLFNLGLLPCQGFIKDRLSS